jgi:hypothetical protein
MRRTRAISLVFSRIVCAIGVAFHYSIGGYVIDTEHTVDAKAGNTIRTRV